MKKNEEWRPKQKAWLDDLDPYGGAGDDAFGLAPLAVGWLTKHRPFATGTVSADFLAALDRFWEDDLFVHRTTRRPCPLCGELVTLEGLELGSAEIRVLGDDDIFAAPDLLMHYITVHAYCPPDSFIEAVLNHPADTPEHRAYIKTVG